MAGLEPATPCSQSMASPTELHPVGTPGGSRTHNQTDFKSATSSNWATGASFGTLDGNRTHNIPFLKRQPLPIGLQEQSLAAPPGLEPGIFAFKGRYVANYTTGLYCQGRV